jgi:hypothetical protein
MVKKDGTVFWVRLAATTAQVPSAAPGQAAERMPWSRVVLSDITERKRVEGEKAVLEARLERLQRHHTSGLKRRRNKGAAEPRTTSIETANEPL